MNYIANALKGNMGICVVLYLCLGITEQLCNGYFGTHYSIPDLSSIFGVVFAKLSVDHGVNSLLNSPKGEMPG